VASLSFRIVAVSARVALLVFGADASLGEALRLFVIALSSVGNWN
jgi:hypothetical protein